jgi:LysR family cyn operon transcriptional activator
MELRQLKYFLKAAELLNFTEAAHAMHISQSTLSQQIRQLEEELDVPLFDRIGKRVVLTEAGETFRWYARQSVSNAESGRQILQEINNLKSGELKIGVTYALSPLLTAPLVKFTSLYPGIKITVLIGTSEELLGKLREVQLDFVLLFLQSELKDNTLVSEFILESPLSLVVSSSSPLATLKSATLEEIGHLPLALPVKGFSTRQFLDRAFDQRQVSPHVSIEINDIPTLFRLVETGNWHTVLTNATVMGQPSLTAIPITGKTMNRKAWITRLSNSFQKKAAVEFCKLLTTIETNNQ